MNTFFNYKSSQYLIKYVILSILFCCFIITIGRTQQDSLKIQIGGFVEVDHISYFKTKEAKINTRNQVVSKIELSSNLSSGIGFYSDIWFREDFSDEGRNRIFFNEAYARWSSNKWDLRLGKQLYNWGQTDGLNPTNNINPIDYTDIIDNEDEEQGVFSLNTTFYWKKLQVQAVVMPVFSEGIYPRLNSRWLSPLPFQKQHPYKPNQSIDVKYQTLADILPSSNIDNTQFALRAALGLDVIDFSLSYFDGYNYVPAIYSTIQELNETSATINIQRLFQRQSVFGADFATTFGKWGFRGEFAYFDLRSEGNLIEDYSFFSTVLGVDRIFSNIIGYNNLHIILQWIHQDIFLDAPMPNTNLNHILQEALFLRAILDLSSYTKITCTGIYDFDAENTYLQIAFEHQITDALNLTILGDIFDGKNNTFFGNFKDNDRIQLKLKYDF